MFCDIVHLSRLFYDDNSFCCCRVTKELCFGWVSFHQLS